MLVMVVVMIVAVMMGVMIPAIIVVIVIMMVVVTAGELSSFSVHTLPELQCTCQPVEYNSRLIGWHTCHHSSS